MQVQVEVTVEAAVNAGAEVNEMPDVNAEA